MISVKIFVIFICSFTSIFALDVAQFYQRLNEPTPAWMKEQIQNDLFPFTCELSRKFLDEFFALNGEELLLTRIRIKDGILSMHKSKSTASNSFASEIIQGFQELHLLAPLPDLDFIFTAHDTLYQRVGPPLPIFTESKDKNCLGLILMPDRWALKGYDPEKQLILEGKSLFPWNVKMPLLFFRGSDTGVLYPWESESNVIIFKRIDFQAIFNPDIWKSFPRPKLVALSLQYPELVDARFAMSLHYQPMIDAARNEGFISDWVSLKDTLAYRYLMDMDGNCCAPCPRTALLLHSNSVMFKQVTANIQWFYTLLKPYVDFIPVKEDLSDILDQIEWAKGHDEECKKISANGQIVAQEALSKDRIYQYLYRLLIEYSKKQKDFYE